MLRLSTKICVEGWYYLIAVALVFFVAMVKDVNLLLALGGMMAGPVVFGWPMLVLSLRGLTAYRKVPQGVCAGDLLVTRISLTNTRPRAASWAVVVQEQIQRETAGRREPSLRPSVLFPHLPAGQTREGVYEGRLPRRGRYWLGPLCLSSRFPFGLFCRTITLGQSESLTVFPRLGRLTGGWFARHQEAFAGTHRRERRHGPEGDFYGVRPWRPGDSRRWIHWRSSARAGKLVVRQFEQPRNRDVAVLLDLWQPEHPQAQHADHVELAVSFAATVVADLCRKGGSKVYLSMTDPQPQCLAGPASAALLQQAMERLALVEPHHNDHLPGLIEEALRRIEPGTEIVVVSTRPVDLTDRDRFAVLWGDPGRRALLRHIRAVDASSKEFEEYFQAE